jgi:tetratricopeptide (TPR) repeat protein
LLAGAGLVICFGTVPAAAQDGATDGSLVDEPLADVSEEATNPAIELLDKATERKLFAKRISDLDQVIDLCEQALEKGLPEESQRYARELMAGTLYEKASQVLAPILQGQMDRSWRQRRRMALESLGKAAEIQPDHGDVQLLIAQLADLPGGDQEAGLGAAEKAVKLLWENPARRSEALLTRAGFRETPEEQFEDVDAAVKASDTNADALRERAKLHLRLDRDEEAIADFMKVMELDDSDADTREIVVQLLTAKEEYEDAIKLVDEFIEADKSSARGYILRSSIRSIQGDDEQAMADIDKAVDIEPSSVAALLSRSQLYSEREEYDEALADIDRVLELQPSYPPALLLRSAVAQFKGDFQLAIRDLKRLLRRDPENVALQLQIAAIHVMDERPRKAVERYTKIIDDHEMEWEAYRGRADALLGIGDHKQAIADYEIALPMADDDSGLLNNLAWVLATSPIDELRDGKRAIKLAETACKITEYKAAHILSTLAAAHAEAGDFEQAIKWSQRAVELGGENEIDEQLKQELASYQEEKPWRERQEQADRVEESEQSLSDLEVSEASSSEPATPSDP